MVAIVVEVTAVVVAVKVAVVLPAATLTLAGTAAEALLLDRLTAMPPAGAAPVRVTVPVEELPPATEAGFSASDISAGPEPAGVIVSDAVWLIPPYVAVIVAVVPELTALVATVKVVVVLPAGTVTLAGTAAEMLLLDSKTAMPPAGAAAFSVTVAVDDEPPATEVGLSANADGAGVGVMVSDAVIVTLR